MAGAALFGQNFGVAFKPFNIGTVLPIFYPFVHVNVYGIGVGILDSGCLGRSFDGP